MIPFWDNLLLLFNFINGLRANRELMQLSILSSIELALLQKVTESTSAARVRVYRLSLCFLFLQILY